MKKKKKKKESIIGTLGRNWIPCAGQAYVMQNHTGAQNERPYFAEMFRIFHVSEDAAC